MRALVDHCLPLQHLTDFLCISLFNCIYNLFPHPFVFCFACALVAAFILAFGCPCLKSIQSCRHDASVRVAASRQVCLACETWHILRLMLQCRLHRRNNIATQGRVNSGSRNVADSQLIIRSPDNKQVPPCLETSVTTVCPCNSARTKQSSTVLMISIELGSSH